MIFFKLSMYFIIVTVSLDPVLNQANWRKVLRCWATPGGFPATRGVWAINFTIFKTVTTMAGNSPELKWQKKKSCLLQVWKYYSGKKKPEWKEAARCSEHSFQRCSCVLLRVEWVWRKQTAASSLEHWKHFLLGDIEIMVRSCQCETRVFFNKGHI